MPIPDLPDFREILSGIRLSPMKASDQDASVEIPFLPAVDETGPVIQDAPLWLHYPNGTKLPFKRLVDRINKELHASQHPRHNDFALYVLALATLMPPQTGDIISRLNKVLGLVGDADVSLYHILAVKFPEQYQFEIPPFTIGPLRAQKLRYKCERAESDFFERYRDMMANAWAIEREPLKVRVFDIPRIRELIFGSSLDRFTRHKWELQAWESIVVGYFSLQNTVLFVSVRSAPFCRNFETFCRV